MESNHKLVKSTSPLFHMPNRYSRLIGKTKLIYLTLIYPELVHAVHTLVQFMQSPWVDHWNAALFMVPYLKGSPGQDILLWVDLPLILTAYCDSGWISCTVTRHSVTGYWIFCFLSSPMSRKTKKQHTFPAPPPKPNTDPWMLPYIKLKWLQHLLLDL